MNPRLKDKIVLITAVTHSGIRKAITQSVETDCEFVMNSDCEKDVHDVPKFVTNELENADCAVVIKSESDDEHYDISLLFTKELDTVVQAREARQKRTKDRHSSSLLKQEKAASLNTQGPSSSQIKMKRIKPNYFVAVQITNPAIHTALKSVHDYIRTSAPCYIPALIPLSTLHITMMVTRLISNDDVTRACSALSECKLPPAEESEAAASPLFINFNGLGHFTHSVLFASIRRGKELDRFVSLADTIEKSFANHGIYRTDSKRDFNPHLTILKLSRAGYSKRKKLKKFPDMFCDTFSNTIVGSQRVEVLQLLSMDKKDETGNYYFCAKQVPLE